MFTPADLGLQLRQAEEQYNVKFEGVVHPTMLAERGRQVSRCTSSISRYSANFAVVFCDA